MMYAEELYHLLKQSADEYVGIDKLTAGACFQDGDTIYFCGVWMAHDRRPVAQFTDKDPQQVRYKLRAWLPVHLKSKPEPQELSF